MQEFAKYLKGYLEKNKISNKKAAQMCNIDRTLIGRYANASRIPKNRAAVANIAKGLGMSEEEAKGLALAFAKVKDGESGYVVQNLVEQIFSGLDMELLKKEWTYDIGTNINYEKEQVCNLSKGAEILYYIQYIVRNAKYISLIMNPEYPEIMDILVCVLKQQKSCIVDQVIEMNSMDGGADVQGIYKFKAVLPLLFSGNHYKVYSHFKRINKSKHAEQNLNVIVTDKGIVLFDRQMSEGIFSNQEHYQNYYNRVCQYVCKNCSLLAGSFHKSVFEKECQNTDYFLKNADSKTIFAYNSRKHSIWIHEKRMDQNAVCIGEEQLSNLFYQFIMEHIQSKKVICDSVIN